MLRERCMSYKMLYNSPFPVARLISVVIQKSQKKTMKAGERPFGVGLLIVGCDDQGPHLYLTSPNAEYYEYYAYSIGAKSQPAKTYLEKHFRVFQDCELKDLIMHGLKALKASEGEIELTSKNVSVGIVGVNETFRMMEEGALKEAILQLHQQQPEPVPMEQ
eukprot:TRINITY_DN5067_c0_g1_i3.p3 TRINITY_DN5067_c0_g1~~TRINITY_DN5067_c0_g1_i3.p3  ORF type:complete len:162 (+),score=60.49 TRINITY_DN5067_c0_g1_i3:135-620(+)